MLSSTPVSTAEIAGRLAAGIRNEDASVVKDCLSYPIPDADRSVLLKYFYSAVSRYAKAKDKSADKLLQIIREFLNRDYNPFELLPGKKISAASFAQQQCVRLMPMFNHHIEQANQRLRTAVAASVCDAFKHCLQAGASITSKSAEKPLVHLAASNATAASLKALLALGASPTDPNSAGYRPMHVAAKDARLESITTLLDAGVDVNQTISEGTITALHIAAYCGNLETVLLLINRGANPLVFASIRKPHKQTSTPLDTCYANSANSTHSLSIAIALVRAFAAVVNQSNFAAVFANIKRQRTSMILLAYFIFELQTLYQPLPKSLLSLLLAEIRLLNRHTASEVRQQLKTLQSLAPNTFATTTLIEKALSFDNHDNVKQTKLLSAITSAKEKEIDYLLDDDSVSIEDKSVFSKDRTPLMNAAGCDKASINVVALLLSRGAYVNASVIWAERAYTALSAAAESNHVEIMKFLCAAGAVVNAPAKTSSPLHWAARAGSEAAVDFLIENNADVFARDEFNQMPVQVCSFETKEQVLSAIALVNKMARLADKKNINEILESIFYLPKRAYDMMIIFLIQLEKRPLSEKEALAITVYNYFAYTFPLWRVELRDNLWLKLKKYLPAQAEKLRILENGVILRQILGTEQLEYLLEKKDKYLSLAANKTHTATQSAAAAQAVVFVDALHLESGTWCKLPAHELTPADPSMTARIMSQFSATISTPVNSQEQPPTAPPASIPFIYPPHSSALTFNQFRPAPEPLEPLTTTHQLNPVEKHSRTPA